MQTIQPLSGIKTLDNKRVRGISPVTKERSIEERICWRAKSFVQNEMMMMESPVGTTY